MTRLCDPPLAVGVELGPEGAPALVRGPLHGELRPVSRWLVEVDWWRQPVVREYWKALVGSQLLVELFHDLEEDAWYLERIYD